MSDYHRDTDSPLYVTEKSYFLDCIHFFLSSCWQMIACHYTVSSKIIRVLEITRVKKLISNAVLCNKLDAPRQNLTVNILILFGFWFVSLNTIRYDWV